MKSSTLRRSNLSKQRMRMLEELSKAKRQPIDSRVEEYQRPVKDNKEKELDVLWQNFRINQKSEKSPGVYLITGFISGVIVTLIASVLLSLTVNNVQQQDFDEAVKPSTEKAKLTFIPADKSAKETIADTALVSGSNETYTVKSGDTLAGIIVRFYGKYDVSKIERIKQANNMSNADSIRIGQELIIPMD